MGKVFKYILYKTTNIINGMIYVGVHKTSTDAFDGYIGQDIYVNRPSSIKNPKTKFARAVSKYGFNAFKRETLKEFLSMEEALQEERLVVDQQFINRQDTYNMITGGQMCIVPTNAITIFVYDIKGNFISKFKSCTEAAAFMGISSLSCVSRVLKKGGIINNTYQVSTKLQKMPNYIDYKGTEFENLVEQYLQRKNIADNTIRKRCVYQYNKNGDFVKEWESLSECRNAGYTNVQAVLEGRRPTCKGFIFKYNKD